MTIPIFKQEIHDGVAELIKNNSIAYTVDISNLNKCSEFTNDIFHPEGAIASADLTWDLFRFNSILVSCGWNSNDDVFDSLEIWNARNTPVFKKINYEHNENDIIGVITSSLVLLNNKLYTGDTPPDNFDIAVSSVIYRKWMDNERQERIGQLISEIEEGKWFVSMECLFPNFDYAVISSTGEHKIVKRNENTAFLTKHLRIYGGSGKYKGNRIGRLPRDLVFSGNGLVKRPANEKSIIFNTKAFIVTKTVENIMDETKKLEDALASLQIENKSLKDQLSKITEEIKAAEKLKFEQEIKLLQDAKASLEAEVSKSRSLLTTASEEITKGNKEREELVKAIAEAKCEKEKMEKEHKQSVRTAKLKEKGIDETKAGELATTFASLTDEQFDAVLSLQVSTNTVLDLSQATITTEAALAYQKNTNQDLVNAISNWLTPKKENK